MGGNLWHRRDLAGRGLTLAAARDLVRRAARPGLRRKRGPSSRLYTAPPADSVVICLDEMGPDRPRASPASGWCAPAPAEQRRGAPRRRSTTGDAEAATSSVPSSRRPGRRLTAPYPGRTTANFVDFLEHVEAWVAPGVRPRLRRAGQPLGPPRPDVLLWALAHPRWEFVFQPTYAAYLNLIEPWWKILRSLALQGPPLRDLDAGQPRGGGRHALLERPSSPFRLGEAHAPPPRPANRHRLPSGDGMNLPDGPLRSVRIALILAPVAGGTAPSAWSMTVPTHF